MARWIVAGLWALLLVIVLAPARPVDAHSFLVSTAPAQGQRLASGPAAVVLVFSEPVEPSTVAVELRTGEGARVDTALPEVSEDGLDVRLAIAEWRDDIYVVAWTAFSALDGHGSSGEFAYAVGDVSGVVPSAVTRSATDSVGISTSWLFFAGLAAAAGALTMQVGDGDTAGLGRRNIVRMGIVVAMFAVLVVLVRARTDTMVLLLCLQALSVGLLLIGFRWGSMAAAVAVVTAVGLWTARGHGADANGVLGWVVDTVHLLSAAAWSGSLVVVVAAAWMRRRRGETWLPLLRCYSRRAVVLVVLAAATGLVAGWGLLPSWDALTSNGYGRLVSAKALLLVLAVSLATTARLGLLPRDRVTGLRRVVTVESVVVVVALVVAAILVNGAPPQPASAAEQLLGPPPMEGAVSRDAGLAGELNVYVAADGDRLDVQVVAASAPVRGTSVHLTVVEPDGSEVELHPRPCGPGCFTQALPVAGGVTSLHVSASAPDRTGGTYAAELIRPPGRRAPRVLGEVIARMRAAGSIELTETVSSGPKATAGGTFITDGAAFIQGEPYAAGNVDEVWLRRGNPDRLVLYLPGSQIYAELDVDDERRIRSSRLVSRGHEITRTFAYPQD